MKKLTAIVLSALMLTAVVPVQGYAENITENVEVIEENGTTILRAGNIEYTIGGDGCARPQSVINRSVSSVYLPASVDGYPVRYDTNQGEVFCLCRNLTEINVDPDNAYLKSMDGVLFSKDGESLYAYPRAKTGDYVIPDGTLIVENHAFERTEQLGSVTVPDSVVEVWEAFYHSSVTEFVGAVPLVRARMLTGCDRLRSITIRASRVGTVDALFRSLPALESLSFVPDVMVTNSVSILQCPKLRHIDLPQTFPTSSLERFGGVDFIISECESLEFVSMYNGRLSRVWNGKIQIEKCPVLQEIEIKQIPYVYSQYALHLSDLPALARITVTEMPQSAVAGTDPADDSVFDPFSIGENCGAFTVSGHLANTNLRRWCEENDVPFESLDKRGDANLDGEISVVDAVMLQRWLLGLAGVSCGESADLNGDGSVDIFDLALLKRMLLER